MPTCVRFLAVVAIVAACTAISAFAAVDVVANAALGGVTYAGLDDTAEVPYPVDTSDGNLFGRTFSTPTLTGGTFTIKGGSTTYTSSARPKGYVELQSMTVSDGNVIITGFLPIGTQILFSQMSGTAKANTPLIDTSAVAGSTDYVLQVTNANVAWAADETVANTQVLVRLQQSGTLNNGAFVLGSSVTRASAIVGIPNPTVTDNSVFENSSVLAVDYITCDGCSNGIIYAPVGKILVRTQAMVRVSHVTIASASIVTLLNTDASAGTFSVTNDGLVVVENISSTKVNVFSGTIPSSSVGPLVLRYLNINSVGATLPSTASYTAVTTQVSDASLDAASHVVNACPAACLNGGTMADATLSCTCSCPSTYHLNFCTTMSDPLTRYQPTACGSGCSVCHNETACTTCNSGFTVDAVTGKCMQDPQSCPDNCKTCTAAGICTVCNDNYVLASSNACVRCTVANCKTCSATDPSRCTECSDGTTPVSNVCPVACTDKLCVSCPTSPDTCVRCADHNGLVANVCTPCADPNCRYCNGNISSCGGCDSGYTLQNGICHSGTATCNLKDCLECDPTDPTRCIKCVAGLIVDSVSHQCIAEGTCSVANCAQCSATSAKECATCSPGYDLSADKKQCTVTPTTTSTTPTPTAACNVPNCAQCASGNPNSCQTCNANFYPSNGQCVRTGTCYVTNCAQCMLRDSTKCSTCKNGYLLSTSYTCISQHINVNAAAAPRSLWVAAAVLAVSAATYLV